MYPWDRDPRAYKLDNYFVLLDLCNIYNHGKNSVIYQNIIIHIVAI